MKPFFFSYEAAVVVARLRPGTHMKLFSPSYEGFFTKMWSFCLRILLGFLVQVQRGTVLSAEEGGQLSATGFLARGHQAPRSFFLPGTIPALPSRCILREESWHSALRGLNTMIRQEVGPAVPYSCQARIPVATPWGHDFESRLCGGQ